MSELYQRSFKCSELAYICLKSDVGKGSNVIERWCPFQSKTALKTILQKCTFLPGLEPLLFDAPSNILKHVLCQFSKVAVPLLKWRSCWIEYRPPTGVTLSATLTCCRCCHMTAGRAACLWPAGGWRKCRRSRQSRALSCRSKSTPSTPASLMRSSGRRIS